MYNDELFIIIIYTVYTYNKVIKQFAPTFSCYATGCEKG